MNIVFLFLILSSFVIGLITGKLDDVVNAMLYSSKKAVEVSISLIGIMAFWLGIVKIAQKSGLINIFSKIISPILSLIFKDIKKGSPAFSNIALNISANALGLQNAATPFGIKAMKDLHKEAENKDIASDSMCMLLAMNTAGFQIVPATVIALLVSFNSKNPTEIIIPTLIVTSIAFVSAIVLSMLFSRIYKG